MSYYSEFDIFTIHDDIRNYKTSIEQLKEELRELHEGKVIIMLKDQDHANAMIQVGMTFGKTFSDGEWK